VLLCTLDYKSLCAAVMICSTPVDIQTDTQTTFDQLITTELIKTSLQFGFCLCS